MKRALQVLLAAALLALPAVSMADAVGVGVVPTVTMQVNTMHYTMSNITSFMTAQSFSLKSGVLSFTVNRINPDDKTAGHAFKGQIEFTGSAPVTVNGKTTTFGNVFMNLSGLLLNADKTKSAAISNGTVKGTLSVTNQDGTFTPGFTGTYSFKTSLTWANNNIASGTINPLTVLISGITMEDNSTDPPTVIPQPVIATVTLSSTPFQVATGPTGAVNVSGDWNGFNAKTDLSEGGPFTLALTQYGGIISGTLISDQTAQINGKTSTSGVTMQFTDGSYHTIAITGVLNADGTMSGTYKDLANSSTGKWGAARTGSAPVGITGAWSLTHNSNMGPESGTTTFNLGQFGSTVLGTMADSGRVVSGTVSGTTVTMSFLDGNGGTIKATGTANMGAVPPTMSGTYTDTAAGKVVDSGTWSAVLP